MFIDRWSREIDRTALGLAAQNLRAIAITSPWGQAGVSALSRDLARSFALSGAKTLLLDMTTVTQVADCSGVWQPGIGGAGQAIVPGPHEYDLLKASFNLASRYRFNNIAFLRQCFSTELAHYGALIIDLPAVNSTDAKHINAAAVAAACDGVVVVCVAGRLRSQDLTSACNELAKAGARVCGTVVNNIDQPTLGFELARQARRISRLLPGTSAWLQRKALMSSLLN